MRLLLLARVESSLVASRLSAREIDELGVVPLLLFPAAVESLFALRGVAWCGVACAVGARAGVV
jgi:hypothetical protein